MSKKQNTYTIEINLLFNYYQFFEILNFSYLISL